MKKILKVMTGLFVLTLIVEGIPYLPPPDKLGPLSQPGVVGTSLAIVTIGIIVFSFWFDRKRSLK